MTESYLARRSRATRGVTECRGTNLDLSRAAAPRLSRPIRRLALARRGLQGRGARRDGWIAQARRALGGPALAPAQAPGAARIDRIRARDRDSTLPFAGAGAAAAGVRSACARTRVRCGGSQA